MAISQAVFVCLHFDFPGRFVLRRPAPRLRYSLGWLSEWSTALHQLSSGVSAGRAEPTAPFCSLAPGILTRKKNGSAYLRLKKCKHSNFWFQKRRKNSSKRRTLTLSRINEYSCDLTGNFRSCFAKFLPALAFLWWADQNMQTNVHKQMIQTLILHDTMDTWGLTGAYLWAWRCWAGLDQPFWTFAELVEVQNEVEMHVMAKLLFS